jgi:Fe-S cluster assembly protein SufB
VKKYLGKVVPQRDNFFATLNSAVFSDGSFVYIPEGVRCPMELSTYFRINAENTGQFERTLIIAEKGSYVSYLEGCTAPMRDENQLHAAVVELVAHEDAEIKYSTVQNWYPGDAEGKGGIYNFVTKRGDCAAATDQDLLDPGRDRKRDHLEVSELHPARRGFSVGEFYSVAVTNNYQQADTGTKMIHSARTHRSTIISKGISAGPVEQHLSRAGARAHRGRERAQLHPVRQPAARRQVRRAHRALHRGQEPDRADRARGDHLEDQRRPAVLRDAARARPQEEAVALIVNGFVPARCSKQLPMEFAVEAQKLIGSRSKGASAESFSEWTSKCSSGRSTSAFPAARRSAPKWCRWG